MPDLNQIKMLWKDLSKQFIGRNPPTSHSLSGSALRNGLKVLHVIVQGWSAFKRVLLVLWLILHNDYKIGHIFKRFLFNEKIAFLNELLFIHFFPFWGLKLRHFGQYW